MTKTTTAEDEAISGKPQWTETQNALTHLSHAVGEDDQAQAALDILTRAIGDQSAYTYSYAARYGRTPDPYLPHAVVLDSIGGYYQLSDERPIYVHTVEGANNLGTGWVIAPAHRLIPAPSAAVPVDANAHTQSGALVFAGTRLPVSVVRSYIECGASNEQIIEAFPTATVEQIDAVRAFHEAGNEPVAATAAHAALPGYVSVPRTPTDGLLMSMAMRYDHGLGVPGYYDHPFFQTDGVSHADRLATTITTMRQLHEEVVGKGFYATDKEALYAARLIVKAEKSA